MEFTNYFENLCKIWRKAKAASIDITSAENTNTTPAVSLTIPKASNNLMMKNRRTENVKRSTNANPNIWIVILIISFIIHEFYSNSSQKVINLAMHHATPANISPDTQTIKTNAIKIITISINRQ